MYNRTFLFITANDNECLAFRAENRFVSEEERSFNQGIVCWHGAFGKYKVWYHHLSKQGAGSQQIIEDVISHIKPDAVILVGITCGNKSKQEQNIGNVLFSEMIIDHSSHKEDKSGKIIPRGGIHTCSLDLFRIFDARRLEFMGTFNNKIFKGQIITYSVKMDNSKSIKKIFNVYNNEPIGYEMEGFYAVRACREKPIVFLVKGVSDFGDGAETDEVKDANQKLAAKNAVDFCHFVFSKDGLGGIQKQSYKTSIEIEHNLPNQNKYFSGREKELDDLNNLFYKDREINAVNICQTVSGLGGIGKTALAVEYAHRYSTNFKNVIWFLVAENSTTLYNGFIEFANHFKIVMPSEFKPEELQSAIRNWLSEHEGWLLIFDNVEADNTIIQLYLPTNINGHYIITTRDIHINIGKPLHLNVFSLADATDFLKRRFSDDDDLKMENYNFTGCNDFLEKASELVKRLGLLPLALEQAGAYISNVRLTITDYLKKLDSVGLEPFKNEAGWAIPTDYKSIVTATWKVSFDKLSEEEKQLFYLCAYMSPNRIPISFFVEMRYKLPEELNGLRNVLEKDSTELTTGLRHYSLASGDAYYIDIHRLVQEVVRESHDKGRE